MCLLQLINGPTAAGQNFVVTDHIRVRGDANYAWWPRGLMDVSNFIDSPIFCMKHTLALAQDRNQELGIHITFLQAVEKFFF
jgi:hypothetical protein